MKYILIKKKKKKRIVLAFEATRHIVYLPHFFQPKISNSSLAVRCIMFP